MNRIKIIARNPAADTAAFVKAPETAAATVRAAKAMAITRSTNAAIGDCILLVTEPKFFTGLHLRGADCYLLIKLYMYMGILWLGNLWVVL